ncbi:hypothetical protein T09_13689 [Trichinella sp. T9]|nr:hypothetical protein T09_13689 [Trichinella sp. T9]
MVSFISHRTALEYCQLFPLFKTDRRKLRLEEEHIREKCSLFNLARKNFVQRNSTDKRLNCFVLDKKPFVPNGWPPALL